MPKKSAKKPTTVLATEAAAVWVPVSELSPWAKNPRKNDRAVKKVRASIERFGFGAPLLARKENGEIIAGHTRLKAAIELGLATVPVRYLDLDEKSAHALALADNRIGEEAEWDDELLAKLLLDASAEDRLAAGFRGSEVDAHLRSLTSDQDGQDDDVEPPAMPITQMGDLWLLGEHRLLCGDSTKPEDVARVMNGERAGLMNTDPPYGVAYANDGRPNPGVAKPRVAKPRVTNDELCDEKLQSFLEACFRTASASALTPDAAWYMWHAHLTQSYFAAAAAAANVVLHRQIIWVKPVLLLGRGQYHWKHEPCFMGWVRGHSPPDYGEGNGERTQTTVWEIASVSTVERRELNHSTPKPVALFEIPMVKHLQKGDVCFEPFAGSGPQFIAAEKLGRRCFGIEIEPRFCDAIVKRWETFTGKKAQRAQADQAAE